MAGTSYYAANALGEFLFRAQALATGSAGAGTGPTGYYVALFTALASGPSGSVTEVSGNNYSRVLVTSGTDAWAAFANGSSSNAATITFPTPSGSWGSVTHFGLYLVSSGGSLIHFGSLLTPLTPLTGNTVEIGVGGITVNIG